MGAEVAETPDKVTQDNNPPELPQQGASSAVPLLPVSLAALAIVGAATANALPSLNLSALPSLPSFNQLSLADLHGFSLPDFASPNFTWPNFSRFTASSPRDTASVRIPDPVVSAALRDIQLSQKDIVASEQQNASALATLTQSATTQQSDLKKISRQLSALATQVDALQGAVAPLTTSSIPHPKPRARVALTHRKLTSSAAAPPSPPPLPKPVGPVSVGGAPLGPAPAPTGSRAG